MSINNYI